MEVGSSSKGKETTNTQRANIQSSDIPSDSNPNPSSNGSSTPYHTSRLAKLDGVLFHFYSKTSAVITQSRLSHYSESHSGQSGSASSNEQVASQSQNQRKASKWFALELEDNEVFKDELRLWRSISSLIPKPYLSQNSPPITSNSPPVVPPMIIDVILDTSSLQASQVLTINSPLDGTEVRADGSQVRATSTDHNIENADSPQQKSIILESWRLDFDPFVPLSPPELPTLYKRSITHFRSLFTLTRALPTHALYERLKSQANNTTIPATEDALRLGCRIGLGDVVQEKHNMVEEISLSEPLGGGPGQDHLKTYAFNDILTPIGNLKLKLTYRTNVDFTVRDTFALSDFTKEIEMDEDFFKPAVLQTSSVPKSISQPQPAPNAIPTSASSVPIFSDRRSLSSATVASASPPVERSSTSRSSTAPSLFSTSAPGRPVAGLSNLRRTGSTAGGLGLATTSNVTSTGSFPGGSTPPSPALAAALGAGDPAFLSHGRRASSSEKRIRTLSTINSERTSPSSPSAYSVGSQQSQLSSAGGHPVTRPTSYGPSLRSGSYSPSSPSPLAQQMTAKDFSASQPRLDGATASLRSIFQSYAPASSSPGTHSSLSLSRTPPRSISLTSTSSKSGNDVPPSPLAPDRSPAKDSPSSTPSDELPPSGHSNTSSSASFRKPTVAPQMIKRYSSTFSYRSGRQQSSGSLGVEGGAGALLPGSGSGSLESSESLPYSRSWAARLEQRQSFNSRSVGREEGASFASRYARSKQSQGGTSQEDDINDFVRMIDSRVQLPSSMRNSAAGSVTAASLSGSRSPSTGASSSIKGNSPLSRSQVDTMLSRMANSVQISPGSGNSGSPQGTTSSPVVEGSSFPPHTRSPLALGNVTATGITSDVEPSGGSDGDGETGLSGGPIATGVTSSISRRGGHPTNSPTRTRYPLLQQHRSSGSGEFHFAYDDEDETAGRLELNPEDYTCSTLTQSQEMERRKVDADLARNFGEELSSTRGKGRTSRSPWRRDHV